MKTSEWKANHILIATDKQRLQDEVLIMYKIGKHEGYDIIPLLETDILFTYPIIKHTVLIFPLGYRFHQHFPTLPHGTTYGFQG